MNPHSYNITVRRANFDGEMFFEARVKELPDVAEYAETVDEAYALAIDTIEATAEVFAEKGKAMPVPYEPADDYSGRVTLRLPKSLHRSLSEGAGQERVSLNQYLVSILNYSSGFCAGANMLYGSSMPVSVLQASKHRGDQPKLTLVRGQERPIATPQNTAWH